MSKKKPQFDKLGARTKLVAAGREYTDHGVVNPGVFHASTIVFDDLASYRDVNTPYRYGRRGTPTSRAVEQAVAIVEGAHDARLCPSGMAAISTALMCFLKTGDHILMVDTVYLPARKFAGGILAKLGIETTFFDPAISPADLAGMMRPNTRMVYLESPGSQTYEVIDVPALAEVAHKHDALMCIDNTWSAGHYFKAFEHGCDISIQAATKYMVGHSDAMLGTIATTKELWPDFRAAYEELGQCAGPDDLYLCLRGIRTLDVRLERHMKNALVVAEWLEGHADVEDVFYPALPSSPGHALWKRDFTGASGLLSMWLAPKGEKALAAMIDGLELFGLGASWGGYESLVLPFAPSKYRSATPWTRPGMGVRLHIGLEDTDDLIADLKAGLERFRKAG
ncbi:MAG: cystathionine beta-lyase [Hyphomicrobiales bacterium]|nr:cystathionine beta-lyase [Hyphomicrobiales bacterium]